MAVGERRYDRCQSFYCLVDHGQGSAKSKSTAFCQGQKVVKSRGDVRRPKKETEEKALPIGLENLYDPLPLLVHSEPSVYNVDLHSYSETGNFLNATAKSFPLSSWE